MRETNRAEILSSIYCAGYSKIYADPGLKEILIALSDTLQQKKVILAFSGDIYRGDDWQYIPLLPENWLDLPPAFQRFSLISCWNKWVPHLFRPVKTIYAGYSRSSAFIYLTDLLFGYDFHKKTVRTRLETISTMGMQIAPGIPSFAFQDSVVNLSRLKIKLLREIFERGGVVITLVDIRQKGSRLELRDRLTGKTAEVEGTMEPVSIPGSIRCFDLDKLPWPRFSMRFRKKGNTFVLHETDGRPAVYIMPQPDESLIREFVNSHFRTSSAELRDSFEKTLEFPAIYEKIPHRVKSWLNQESKLHSGERPVEDILETAFDIAKQTGIGFMEFSALFFRYGEHVEWMTDEVYERMAYTRNPDELWAYAEQLYHQKYEWAPGTAVN